MSWFSELTGKAGALLDKMDQAAASSLQDAGLTNTPSSKTSSSSSNTAASRHVGTAGSNNTSTTVPYEPTTTTYQSLTTPSERGAAVAQVLVGSASGSAHLTSTPRPSSSQKQGASSIAATSSTTTTTAGSRGRQKQLDTDDSIFEFLNTPSEQRGESRKLAPRVAVVRTTTPSLPSSSSLPNMAKTPGPGERRDSHQTPTPELSRMTEQPEVDMETRDESGGGSPLEMAKVEAGKDEVDGEPVTKHSDDERPAVDEVADEVIKVGVATELPPSNSQSEQQQQHAAITAELEEWKRKVSNLQLENKLMKREVGSLNEELSTLTARASEAAADKSQREDEMRALREHVSKAEQSVRRLRSQEEDLRASVEVRDSQLEVLRTRLAEADRALSEEKERVASSKREQERLLQDVNLSSGAQNQAMESLKTQLSQSQAQLAQLREEQISEKRGFAERERLLRLEQTKLTDDLTAVQRQLVAEQTRSRELQVALQGAQRDMQALRREHEDYKHKAAGILQAKEKLISALQNSEGSTGTAGEARLEEARVEKEHLQARLTNTLSQLERVRKDLQDLEEKSSADMDGALEQVRVCEGVLTEEKRQHAGTREELVQLNQELDIVREDLVRERTKHREDVDAKEAELADLKLRMTSLTPGRVELESRLHELTESLIQKQTTLETLNSEKSTLNVQLQRLQGELAQAHRSKVKAPHTSIQVNALEQNSEGSQVHSMSSVIPSLDGAPSGTRLHNVRKAVNMVDRISIRLGTFLKRYPQARLLTLFYMLLLHVWVMVVMLTYTPEAHDPNDPRFHAGM